MSYLPFSGNCIANVYESNESDKDENISEDLPLKLTVHLISMNQLEDKTQPSNHVMIIMNWNNR